MRETWLVLEDGTAVPPSEVSVNKDGRLAHKAGLVAIRDDGETPRSRGVDVDDEKAKSKPPAKKTVVMEPEPEPEPTKKAGYKTRAGKGRK